MIPLLSPIYLTHRQLLAITIGCLSLQYLADFGRHINIFGSYSILLDSVAHGSLALMVILPWLIVLKLPFFSLPLAIASAIFIDLDHFVAAGSWSLDAAISLSRRPFVHSLLMITLIAGFVKLLLPRRWLAGIVFLALLTHLSRDATSGGTPLLWPLTPLPTLPITIHWGIWLIVTLIGILIIFLNPEFKEGLKR